MQKWNSLILPNYSYLRVYEINQKSRSLFMLPQNLFLHVQKLPKIMYNQRFTFFSSFSSYYKAKEKHKNTNQLKATCIKKIWIQIQSQIKKKEKDIINGGQIKKEDVRPRCQRGRGRSWRGSRTRCRKRWGGRKERRRGRRSTTASTPPSPPSAAEITRIAPTSLWFPTISAEGNVIIVRELQQPWILCDIIIIIFIHSYCLLLQDTKTKEKNHNCGLPPIYIPSNFFCFL